MRTKFLLKAKKFFLQSFGNKKFPSKEEISNTMMDSSFIPMNPKIMFSLFYTQELVEAENQKRLSNFNINAPQFEILKILYFAKESSMTQDDIVKVMFTSKANVSTQLSKLEKESMIKRKENPNNKRQKIVILCKNGEEKLYEVAEIINPWAMKDILNKQESIEYIKLNQKIRENIHNLFGGKK
jgi:DNA-binding MarR family transcriptional regulator